VSGITRVFFAKDFISVTKEDSADWDKLKPLVMETIDSHFEQNLPLFSEEVADSTDDTKILPGDSEAL
jgi:NFU1 iron-sulfur cluster scaffold homolog, mitochondrial